MKKFLKPLLFVTSVILLVVLGVMWFTSSNCESDSMTYYHFKLGNGVTQHTGKLQRCADQQGETTYWQFENGISFIKIQPIDEQGQKGLSYMIVKDGDKEESVYAAIRPSGVPRDFGCGTASLIKNESFCIISKK